MKKKISSMGIVGVIHPPPREAEFLVLEIEGEWVFPKGHVHAGEDFVDAAIREVEEESGVHLTRGEHLGQVDTFSFCFEGEQTIKVIERNYSASGNDNRSRTTARRVSRMAGGFPQAKR